MPETTRIITGALILPRSGVIKVNNLLCLECRECEVACSLYHVGECNPYLSRIQVNFDDFIPIFPTLDVCKQCEWPACYYMCVTLYKNHAMYIDEKTGARVIDEEKCTGCGSCAKACPLMPERMTINFRETKGRRSYFKCDLCKDRVNGPVCVESCPTSALTFVPPEER